MSTPQALTGLWPPVTTPFAADGSVDFPALVKHSKTLLDEGSTGLAILGTTSEANSLTLDERRRVIDAHVEAGIDPGRLIPGTGACAIDDAAALTRHAGELGAAAVLLLPPFFYKGVSDDGLFAFVSAVIERSGPKVPRIMLYHIPPMAAVGWSHALVARLIKAFPGIVAGMKDSSGDADHTRRTIEAFPDFAVFPALRFISRRRSTGARRDASRRAPTSTRAAIAELIAAHGSGDLSARQDKLNLVRTAVQSRGLIPAIKAVLAARYRNDGWRNVRPPLVSASDAMRAELLADPAIAAII